MNHVLVVDDDPGIRGLARLILVSAGFEVSLAANGQDALDSIHSHLPTVMVLDLSMPVMDGRELFKALVAEGSRPPTIILSAYKAESTRKELGAEASLAKPFDPEVLLAKVEALRSTA